MEQIETKDEKVWYLWATVFMANFFYISYLILVNITDNFSFTDLIGIDFIELLFLITIFTIPVLSIMATKLGGHSYFENKKTLINIPAIYLFISAYGYFDTLTCEGKLCELGGLFLIFACLTNIAVFFIFYFISKFAQKKSVGLIKSIFWTVIAVGLYLIYSIVYEFFLIEADFNSFNLH